MLSETNCASLLHLFNVFRRVIDVQIGQYNFVCALNIFRQSIWKAMVCFPHVVIRDKLCFFTAPFQTSNWCSVTGQGITFLVALNIFRQSIWKMMVRFLRGLLTRFFFQNFSCHPPNKTKCNKAGQNCKGNKDVFRQRFERIISRDAVTKF